MITIAPTEATMWHNNKAQSVLRCGAHRPRPAAVTRPGRPSAADPEAEGLSATAGSAASCNARITSAKSEVTVWQTRAAPRQPKTGGEKPCCCSCCGDGWCW